MGQWPTESQTYLHKGKMEGAKCFLAKLLQKSFFFKNSQKLIATLHKNIWTTIFIDEILFFIPQTN